MTKRYGSYVGTPRNSNPPVLVDLGYEKTTDQVLVRDTIELAAAPIADQVVLGTMGWETIVDCDAGVVAFDALGASTTLSVGDVTYPAALAAATATNAAGSYKPCKSVDIANYWKPLWALLGYASLAAAKAVGDQCQLLATIAGAAATGTVTWQIKGQSRI